MKKQSLETYSEGPFKGDIVLRDTCDGFVGNHRFPIFIQPWCYVHGFPFDRHLEISL